MAATPMFVLVAGYDYHGSGVDFRGLVDDRVKRLLKGSPDATIVIHDVGRGEVRTSVQPPTPSGSKKRPKREITSDTTTFTAVSKKNYSGSDKQHPHRFDANPDGIMSITDVYAALRAIGAVKETAGAVREFSIFSHGFYGGAVLVNSDDTSSTLKRAPDDKDCRDFDFRRENMTPAQLRHLRAAFADEGICRLWGCAFTESYRQVLFRLLKSSPYRKAKPGTLKDHVDIPFDFAKDQAEDFFSDDETFFPKPTRQKNKKTDQFEDVYELSFTRTFKEVKAFFRRGLRDTYAQALATGTGCTCYSAFPGTYADYERGVKLPLMLIPRKVPPYADDFSKSVEFFKTSLKIAEDPESRGYATYDP